MADIPASAVSLYPTSLNESEFYLSKKGPFTRRVKLTNITGGGATNKLTASALGFKKLLSCSAFYRTDGTPAIIPAVVDPANNIILLGGGTSFAIGDVTGATGYMMVTGS